MNPIVLLTSIASLLTPTKFTSYYNFPFMYLQHRLITKVSYLHLKEHNKNPMHSSLVPCVVMLSVKSRKYKQQQHE